jgi:phosphate transport system substrate-binding protein
VKLPLAARAIGATAAVALTVAACGSDNNASSNTSANGSCAGGTVTGQGSTFQQNIEKQWISDFGSKCSGAQITYTGTGSGAGIQQFGSGTIDYAGSDVVMKADEQSAADRACGSTAVHIPVTAGGIAIIYNLDGVDNLQLSADTLAGIFAGTITKWNDPKIAADNSGAKLPDTSIKTYHRADGSGTTSVLSAYLKAAAPGTWKLGSDKTLNWPSGQAANGSSGVVAGVKQTPGSITYAEVSYAKQNSLPTAKLKSASGSYVDISGDSVSQSIDSGFSVTGSGNDLAGTLDFTKMTGYPISTVSYAIACSTYKDSKKGAVIKAFLTYAVGDGQGQADALGFAPLPASLVTKDQAAIAALK